MSKLLTLTLVLICMGGCASGGHQTTAADAHSPPPANAKQLSGGEINSKVIGRTHSSVTTTGYQFTEILNPDGSAIIEISSESKQKGSWVLTDDVICVEYQKYGKECNKVFTDGVRIWFVDSEKNTTNNTFTVK